MLHVGSLMHILDCILREQSAMSDVRFVVRFFLLVVYFILIFGYLF